jgi:hypothetical protein
MSGSPFREILHQAQEELWLAFERTKAVQHKGLKGSGRENALDLFLREQLPSRFGVARGEAFDMKKQRSAQLDIVVYDQMGVKPLKIDNANVLFPAEALLAVIEVKSVLTRAELEKALVGAGKIAQLRPYDRAFIVERTGGVDASDRSPRCLFTIFAFQSDLGREDWPANEWTRLRAVAGEQGISEDKVSRLVVLDRGMLIPPHGMARKADAGDAPKGTLREWFLHLTNFLAREIARRDPLEWQLYETEERREGWVKLEGFSGPPRSNKLRTPRASAEDETPRTIAPRRRRGRGSRGRRRGPDKGESPMT